MLELILFSEWGGFEVRSLDSVRDSISFLHFAVFRETRLNVFRCLVVLKLLFKIVSCKNSSCRMITGKILLAILRLGSIYV